MKPYTKELIRKTFVKQLNERPFNKITVKSISEECEMNRNTFYYYYSDIYEVLTELFNIELQKVIDKYNENQCWEESFNVAVESCMKNKAAVYHIYNSVRREELENYIQRVSGDLMNRLVVSKCADIDADEKDIEIIVYFFQCAVTQMIISWISDGMLKDCYFIIDRVGTLFDKSIERALVRSSKEKKL